MKYIRFAVIVCAVLLLCMSAWGEKIRTAAALLPKEKGVLLEYAAPDGDTVTIEYMGHILVRSSINGRKDIAVFDEQPAGSTVGILFNKDNIQLWAGGRFVQKIYKTLPLTEGDYWHAEAAAAIWTKALSSKELTKYMIAKKPRGAYAWGDRLMSKDNNDYSLDVYDRNKYMLPFWSAGTIYHESVMFVEGDTAARLMLPAEKIYEVRSSDLKTLYKEGKDYRLEDGCLVPAEGTSMPIMPLDEFYPDPASAQPGTYFNSTVEGHPLLGFSETPKFIEKQIAVTYKLAVRWDGPVPMVQDKFGRFLKKLWSGEPVTVVYYGDSISTGANASSMYGRSPNAENWCRMSASAMSDITGNENINYVNTAVGGMESIWAVDNIEDRVIKYKPDLLVYAFGMNDHTKPCEEFIALTDKSVRKVQAACPDCDVLLVSTMLPHKRGAGFWNNQDLYEDAMAEYVKDKEHIGLAPVTSLHRYLLTRKEYYHATGNNVNHPNDFLHRIYAQAIIKVIFDR